MPSQILTSDNADFASATSGSATTSFLIPRQLLGEVMNAVRRDLLLRGLAARVFGPSQIPGRTLVIPRQTEFTSLNHLPVDQVGEGGEIPLGQSVFDNLTVTPVKYGIRVGVSRELQEDGILDLISYHAELAGYEFARNEESLIISTWETASGSSGANHDVANSNATLPITDITEAMQNLETADYVATHMIVGVEVANDLRNIEEFNTAKDTGGPNITNQKLIGSILQMKVIMSNAVSAKIAFIIDARHSFLIAEKRSITVERYTDFARDTGYVVVTQRVATAALRNTATVEITTT